MNWLVKWILELLQGKEPPVAGSADIIEAKVVGAAVGATAGGIIGSVISLLPLPPLVKRVLVTLLPILSTFVGGWLTPHTRRMLPPV